MAEIQHFDGISRQKKQYGNGGYPFFSISVSTALALAVTCRS